VLGTSGSEVRVPDGLWGMDSGAIGFLNRVWTSYPRPLTWGFVLSGADPGSQMADDCSAVPRSVGASWGGSDVARVVPESTT
jgi:hypothetical protein